jgi:hypothetical protein
MSLPKQFESMAWCIDVIVVPIFGLLFILCSGVGTMAIGLACMVYGVVRFAFNRRQNKF